jgi:hypothetical protein
MKKFLLWLLLLLLCLSGAVIGLQLLSEREDVEKMSACQGCLKCIGMAMHQYHEKYETVAPLVQRTGLGASA